MNVQSNDTISNARNKRRNDIFAGWVRFRSSSSSLHRERDLSEGKDEDRFRRNGVRYWRNLLRQNSLEYRREIRSANSTWNLPNGSVPKQIQLPLQSATCVYISVQSVFKVSRSFPTCCLLAVNSSLPLLLLREECFMLTSLSIYYEIECKEHILQAIKLFLKWVYQLHLVGYAKTDTTIN